VHDERRSTKLSARGIYLTMTTPANAVREEVRELIDDQIETFGRTVTLTPSEVSEYHCRAERIKQLVNSLIGSEERPFWKRDSGRRLSRAVSKDPRHERQYNLPSPISLNRESEDLPMPRIGVPEVINRSPGRDQRLAELRADSSSSWPSTLCSHLF